MDTIQLNLNRQEILLYLRTLLAVRGVAFTDGRKPDVAPCEDLIGRLKSAKGSSNFDLHLTTLEAQISIEGMKAFLHEFPDPGMMHAHIGFWPDDLSALEQKLAQAGSQRRTVA